MYGLKSSGNADHELRPHQSNEGDEYKYDGLYRVTAAVYDDAAPATPTAPTAGTGSDIFYYDGVGNRTKAYERSADATEYLHNPVNEYTKVANTEWEHDAAGIRRGGTPRRGWRPHLTKDDARYYYWDYENRLTRVTDQSIRIGTERARPTSSLTSATMSRDVSSRRSLMARPRGTTTLASASWRRRRGPSRPRWRGSVPTVRA